MKIKIKRLALRFKNALKWSMKSAPKGQTVILIATLLGFLLLYLVSDTLTWLAPTYKRANGHISSLKAQYLAEYAVEQALYDVTHNGPGFQYENESDGWVEMSDLAEGQSVKYKISGRGGNSDRVRGYYSIPEPGTGNAGEGCENYDLQADILEKGEFTALKNPCNWSKLGEINNEYAVIPLYVDEGGGVILNPRTAATAGGKPYIDLQEIQVKMRTPCRKDAESLDEWGNCADLERFELDCGDGDPAGQMSEGCVNANYKEGDDTIVNWEIKGECDKGFGDGSTEMCAIWAVDEVDNATKSKRVRANSSEIYESLINDKKRDASYRVLTISNAFNSNKGKTLQNFDIPINIFSFLTAQTTTKPVLQMQIIKSPKAGFPDEAKNIRYLEYQILYKVNNEETLPNNMRKVEAQANIHNYVIRMESSISQQGSISGFVIIN